MIVRDKRGVGMVLFYFLLMAVSFMFVLLYFNTFLLVNEKSMVDIIADDAVLVERLGCPVKMVKGCYSNIKITTREDLILVREFMK